MIKIVKVKAIKPVFVGKWHHPGDEFECSKEVAKEKEKLGKVKLLKIPGAIKQENKK